MGEWPGPRSKELQKERDRYLPRGMGSTMPVFAASGSGAMLTDVDGYTYIDFPNSFADPKKVDRTALGYPYQGIFKNG